MTIDLETGEILDSKTSFEITVTGLKVTGSPSYDEWMSCGHRLIGVKNSLQWCIGDWLVYGEGRGDWGEMYAQAMDGMGISYQSLADYAKVSKRFQFSRRRLNLSWSHHETVLTLKSETEQDTVLDAAIQDQWNRDEVRAIVKQMKTKTKPAPLPASTINGLSLLPSLYVSRAENMPEVLDESVDLIITSPPYNLGDEHWPMGGNGRAPRKGGIGYADNLNELHYQDWQVDCLVEMFRVAKPGASLFYNHKVRIENGNMIHPMDWLRDERNPWMMRQEIIWDRKSTHNHSPSLFWPEDERIYWMTKGKPLLQDYSIGMSTIWREFGPEANRSWHPAPFPDSLPELCIKAVGRPGITVLDPFAGSCTTIRVALAYGYNAIGVDTNEQYLAKVKDENGWTATKVS